MIKCIKSEFGVHFMKKIIITILILLIAGVGGTAYYFLKVKTYDLSQDTALEGISEEEYEIVLPPDVDLAKDDGDESSKEGNPSSAEIVGQIRQENSQSSKPKVTVETIKEKYRPSFESLESQADGKINALAGHAISEYKEKKANGEKISVNYFLTKYKTAGEALEAKMDQAFEQLYGALQKELKANGFSPDEAADIRSSYEAGKKERKNALLSSALDKLK